MMLREYCGQTSVGTHVENLLESQKRRRRFSERGASPRDPPCKANLGVLKRKHPVV